MLHHQHIACRKVQKWYIQKIILVDGLILDRSNEVSYRFVGIGVCVTFLIHSFSSDSTKAIIIKRNSTGVILSHYSTPPLNGIDVSNFLMINLKNLFLYIGAITDCRLAGTRIFQGFEP